VVRLSRNPDALRALIEEIEIVRHDEYGRPLGVLPELRELLAFDALVFARPMERTTGWTLEGFESDGLANPTRFKRSLLALFETSPKPTPWLDLREPRKEERNAAVDVEERVGRDQYRESTLYQRVLAPSGLAECHVTRMLICEGSQVLAWIGGVSDAPVSREQRALFATIAPALLHRLRIERLLGTAPRVHAALEATLQHIGAPAMLVDARGRIHEMNRAARDLLATKRAEVSASIGAVLQKKTPELPFSLTRVSATGMSDQFLAVMRPRSAEARMSMSVTIAASRWKLTPRQAEVLRLIVQGESNATIARQLGISHRAAELHITAIFDRAGVASRSQLVAAVLLG